MRLRIIFAAFMVAILLGGGFYAPPTAKAQLTPEIILTWSTDTYTPAMYAGKALPVTQSEVAVSALLLIGGAAQDISSQEIRWFLDGYPLRSGIGRDAATFTVTDGPGNTAWVQVEIDHNGQTFEKNVRIPIASPEIVLTSRSFNTDLLPGANIITAQPYYFQSRTVHDLSFEWTVNGEKLPSDPENPHMLLVDVTTDTPPGYTVNANVFVSNPAHLLESARAFNRYIVTGNHAL